MAADADEMTRGVGHEDQGGVLIAEIVLGTAVVIQRHATHGQCVVLIDAHIPHAWHHLQGAFPLGGVVFEGADGTYPDIVRCPGGEVGEGAFGVGEACGVGLGRDGGVDVDIGLPYHTLRLAVPTHGGCGGGEGGDG